LMEIKRRIENPPLLDAIGGSAMRANGSAK